MINKYEFSDSSELQDLIDKYFKSLEPTYMTDEVGEVIKDKSGIPVLTPKEPATVSSLAYAIGCSSREKFLKLKKNPKFTSTINRALLRMEAYTEKMLFDKSTQAGAKFMLEIDFGRSDVKDSIPDESGGVVILADIEQ